VTSIRDATDAELWVSADVASVPSEESWPREGRWPMEVFWTVISTAFVLGTLTVVTFATLRMFGVGDRHRPRH
jgi:hypothetical protein